MKIKNKELWRTIKYTLFMLSAGVIQFAVSAALKAILDATTEPRNIYFIIEFTLSTFVADTVGLFCSIIWNFTFNRKFTFKAANNVPLAMGLALLFYVPFYPFQIWYVDMVEKQLASIGFWGYLIGLVSCMILNGVLEFLWQRFVIYRKSVDTNAAAQKEADASVNVTVNVVAAGSAEASVQVDANGRAADVIVEVDGGAGSGSDTSVAKADVASAEVAQSDVADGLKRGSAAKKNARAKQEKD